MAAPTKSHGRKTIKATLKPRELVEHRPTLKGAFNARVITLFPELFPGVLGGSLTGKALDQGLWQLQTVDLRRYGEGKHRNVDDTPSGGGAGMVLRADILSRAIETAQSMGDGPVVYLSPRGKPFNQQMARNLAAMPGVTLICGRFEGVDERVLEHHRVEEISLGDFVLTGGEIAAQAVLDATIRLIPGVLGNAQSAVEESFSNGLLEHPQYTRPQVWEGREIPPVLTSGNHKAVAEWRREMSEEITRTRRPDLWAQYTAKDGSKDQSKS
ncbi:tRNA (guanosine(37)-N1)-methyltransferase TrmD [Roseobacteraceae bacterium S113]